MQNRLKTTTLNPSRQHVVVTTQAVLDKNSNSWLNKLSNLVLLGQLGNQWIPELMNILSGPNIEKILGRPIQSLMIEGGSKTLTQFISAGYGDIFHLFIAPLITGGIKNRIALQKLLNQAVRLNTLSSTRLKSDILIELISEEIKEKIF
jgi:diaminohydroxyphosphoribosylaminopyrimidine deaminase/5-amino-6-(5-phosphoribosylamino)uracil reductase